MQPSRLGVSLLLLAATLGCRALPGGARTPATYDAKTFYETTSLAGASFSADGTRLLVTSDASGVFNAYAIDIASEEMSQLTESTTDLLTGNAAR